MLWGQSFYDKGHLIKNTKLAPVGGAGARICIHISEYFPILGPHLAKVVYINLLFNDYFW